MFNCYSSPWTFWCLCNSIDILLNIKILWIVLASLLDLKWVMFCVINHLYSCWDAGINLGHLSLSLPLTGDGHLSHKWCHRWRGRVISLKRQQHHTVTPCWCQRWRGRVTSLKVCQNPGWSRKLRRVSVAIFDVIILVRMRMINGDGNFDGTNPVIVMSH